MKRSTSEQKRIASAHGVPLDQAWSINVNKAKAYERFKKSAMNKVETFLDSLEEERTKRETKEAEHVEMNLKYGNYL